MQIDDLIKEIQLSIQEIGFNNTANIYSVSNSAKFGGQLGWIKKTQLSKKIQESVFNKFNIEILPEVNII